ncbi:MAG: hypothetical protein HY904_25085 [Deltaproteobacteria bacterium]|nr:hypothetical protein [Deltaproteobacteria bacterium]
MSRPGRKDRSTTATATPAAAEPRAHAAHLPPVGTPATLPALDGLDVDTLVLLCAEDERPLQGMAGLLDWRMCGWLSAQLAQGAVTGKPGEHVLTWPAGRVAVPRVILVGTGPGAQVAARMDALLVKVGLLLANAGCRRAAVGGGAVPGAVIQEALGRADAALKARVTVVLDGEPA